VRSAAGGERERKEKEKKGPVWCIEESGILFDFLAMGKRGHGADVGTEQRAGRGKRGGGEEQGFVAQTMFWPSTMGEKKKGRERGDKGERLRCFKR